MLINNYSFNYFLQVKKIDNNIFEILSELFDYDILYNICNNSKKIKSELKVYFFNVDQVFNILNNN